MNANVHIYECKWTLTFTNSHMHDDSFRCTIVEAIAERDHVLNNSIESTIHCINHYKTSRISIRILQPENKPDQENKGKYNLLC